ncbi:hypothetical protein GW831_02295 [Candidatus Wolfebacteria bacterium]|nr:hypothetical protein [Parcubacteria group bacterium]NCP58585.1 hypothetical protein [Candidatus Wolfebacteria bacterium]
MKSTKLSSIIKELADLIYWALIKKENSNSIEKEIKKICKKFPAMK